MKLSKINFDQLACTRIILRNVEPKLDSLYTLLLVASDCKGKVHLSQNTLADILKVKNGRISKMFDQLSNLNLLAKDYLAPNGKQQVHTLLPVTKSALRLHANNIGNTGFEAMIEAVKEQSKGLNDGYLDLDAIKRQVALDKLQSALQTVPRKAYTHKNNSAPMKYAHMFDNDGLSSYYAEIDRSPEEVESDDTRDNSRNGCERLREAETIGIKKVKTISRRKTSSNVQHTIYAYIDIIEVVNKKDIELNILLSNKSITPTTDYINHVIHSETKTTSSTEPISSTLPALQPVVEAPKVENVVTPITPEPCQSSTGLRDAIVTGKTTQPLIQPFPTRQKALEARFQDFNVHNAPDTEKMAYCIYSYNRLVKLLPNLKQMQYPKALMEGRFENRAGAPAWMDNLCEFVSGQNWYQKWTAGLVRIAKNSFLRDGIDAWKLNFIWMFTEWNTINDDGEVEVWGDINFIEKIIGNGDYPDPTWYRKYDDKDWFPTEMEAADIRLIDIDSWFKTNVEMFNCDYAYPVEGTFPESAYHTPEDEYFVMQNGYQYMNGAH